MHKNIKRVSFRIFPLTMLFALVGCHSNQPPKPWTTPLATGSIYHSKLGNFTCVVPQLIRPDARQAEHADNNSADVLFSDNLGTLLRIESDRIPPDQLANFTGNRAAQTLNDCFDQTVAPQSLGKLPANAIARREILQTNLGPVLFVAVNVAGGATLGSADRASENRRLDSLRGMFVFAQSGFLYVMTNQEWPGTPTLQNQRMEVRVNRLLANLKNELMSMTFTDATAPLPPQK